MTSSSEDALIEAAVEEALGPCASLLPPHLVEELRKSLRLSLLVDPKAQDIVGRLRARPPREHSGKARVDGAEEHDDQGERGSGGAG